MEQIDLLRGELEVKCHELLLMSQKKAEQSIQGASTSRTSRLASSTKNSGGFSSARLTSTTNSTDFSLRMKEKEI